MLFGRFSADATREEIQRKAFEATEREIFARLEIWVNVAALRAKGQEKDSAEAFLPILQEAAYNPWGISPTKPALPSIAWKRRRVGNSGLYIVQF